MAALPLKDAANIVHGNALRLNWEAICPSPQCEEEVYIAGNPPWLWSNEQNKQQKEDMQQVFKPAFPKWRVV